MNLRTFQDIKKELGLSEFLESTLGTLYFTPPLPDSPPLLIRHLDAELPARLTKPFSMLYSEASTWIEGHSALSALVRMELPTEIGYDFIARPYHSYYISTWTYAYGENPPEVPGALLKMRGAFEALKGVSTCPIESLLERVLSRSILEPSGKTFLEGDRFLILDPKATPGEIERWAELKPSS